jgi:3-dehydroquinate dehydratase-2
MRVDVLHGPNLNLLGEREPAHYGLVTLPEIDARLAAIGKELSCEVRSFQSNHEGALIDYLHATRKLADAYILNPAGYTHTSVALRDAVIAVNKPTIEVHLSTTEAREAFRHKSLLADVVMGRIQGLGAQGYEWALRALVAHLSSSQHA